MARTDTLVNFVTDICNATRNKTGKTDPILLSELDTEIESIETGGGIPSKGLVITKWNTDGYPTEIEISGIEDTGQYLCYYTNILGCYIEKIIFKSDVIIIGNNFANGTNSSPNNLTNVQFCDTIKEVGNYAFRYRPISNVQNMPLLEKIGDYAFSYCSELETFIFSKKLLSIGREAFMGCTRLSDIGNNSLNVSQIGINAFNSCGKLGTILFGEASTISAISEGTFDNCSNFNIQSLPTTITSIGSRAFRNCMRLSLTSLPQNLKTIYDEAFKGCVLLKVKTLPNVTTLRYGAFSECTSIVQMSMPTIVTFNVYSNRGAVFYGCTSLKAVWFGSSIQNPTRYALCTSGSGTTAVSNVEKIFFNLPRATVESFTGYNYAFVNDTTKASIIICNDDEGFLTREEFDAIDWSTYTG